MSSDNFDIQELVKESGVPRRTIYFYVQQGILPPPRGAGLSAHYTEDHLLRLKLIPVFRGQGLRLDEIRQRLENMEKPEMERMLLSAQTSTPAPQPRRGLPVLPLREVDPSQAAPLPAAAFTHYALPGGMTLVVPGERSSADQRRVKRLLEAAVQIFSGEGEVQPQTRENGKRLSTGPSQAGEAQEEENE